MITFLWGAVIGSLVCLMLGAVAGGGNIDNNYDAHIRTEWSTWFIILMIASGVSIYVYNYAGR